jgi:hypothetical protein
METFGVVRRKCGGGLTDTLLVVKSARVGTRAREVGIRRKKEGWNALSSIRAARPWSFLVFLSQHLFVRVAVEIKWLEPQRKEKAARVRAESVFDCFQPRVGISLVFLTNKKRRLVASLFVGEMPC